MLSVASERARRALEDALSGRDAARRMRWHLYIGGEDYSERLKDGGYTTEDGLAMMLDLDVAGMLSESLEGEEVLLEWVVDGVSVYGFTGTLMRVRYNAASGRTVLTGASAGEVIERTELGERIEYGGVNPSTAIHDALTRVSGYRQALVRIQTVESPKFYRQNRDAYSATDFAGNIVEAVQSESPRLALYDSADGGCRALVSPNLADMPEPVWTFEVGRDVRREDFESGRDDDLYREVVVRRPVANPAVGVDPWTVLARIEVAGSRAPAGTVERVDVSDDATNLEAFFRQAHEAAQAHSYRIGPISWISTYVHPLLERGDVVAVMVPGKDEHGKYRERWLCVLDDACCPDVRRKRGRYGGEARVVATERERRTPALLGGLTPGVVPPSEVT